MAHTFAVNDRVVLLRPEEWIDKCMQVRARRRVPATVVAVLGTAHPPAYRWYRIKFDRARGLEQCTVIVSVNGLERIPAQEA